LSAQNNLAILVANQNYIVGNKLKNPINDIKELQTSFEQNGYKTLVFYDLTLDKFNGPLLDSIRAIITASKKQTKLYFHYAGHALQVDNTNYFVPVDFKKIEFKSDIKRKCFCLNNLFEVLSELIEENSDLSGLISIDACRTNPFTFDGINNGLAEPPYNFNIYNQFGVLYSVGINETASDGKNLISPFVNGLIKSINNCEDFNLVWDRIVAEYYQEGFEKKPYFEGSLNFSFCDQENTKASFTNDWTEEYISILGLITNDFFEGKYQNLLEKADLINRITQANKVKIAKDSNEHIKFELYVAIAHFHLNHFDKAIPSLISLTRNSLNSEKIEIFNDAYFYLARYYTLNQSWKELYTLRRNFLNFSLLNEDYFDAAITYDKIAGDYEHQYMQDSAKTYYLKATSMFDSIKIVTPDTKHYASLIYGNTGKCYAYGVNIDYLKSIYFLEQALKLSEGNIQLEASNLTDLIGVKLSLDTSVILKEQINSHILHHFKLCEFSQSLFDHFYHWDLALTYYEKYCMSDSLTITFDKLSNLIVQQNDLIILNDTLISRRVNNSCSISSRQITVEMPNGILPILFFDKNKNSKFDNYDFKISPNLAEIDTILVTEFGSNSAEQWVLYSNVKKAKNAGIYSLEHNNSHSNSQTTNLSYCIVFPTDNKTVWQFRVDCSELDVCNSPFYIGLKNARLKDKSQQISVDDIVRFIPIFPLTKEGLSYSFSTLN
jgi:hypothetical protein